MSTSHPIVWRKSTRSGGNNGACVELSHHDAIRDSKNPAGPTLHVDLAILITAARSGHLDR